MGLVERYVYSRYMRCSRLVFTEYFRQVLQAGRSVLCLPGAVGELLMHVLLHCYVCAAVSHSKLLRCMTLLLIWLFCPVLSAQYKYNTKLGWALFVTYTIIQSIMRSEMCSLHLTHPSVHTWSSGQPTVQRPGSSRGLPAGVGIRTHNLGLPRVSSRTLYPLGQRLPCCLAQ